VPFAQLSLWRSSPVSWFMWFAGISVKQFLAPFVLPLWINFLTYLKLGMASLCL
jgi:hypothetical protein